jgi:hypothetical protein
LLLNFDSPRFGIIKCQASWAAASFTASSAARFNTFKPSSANELNQFYANQHPLFLVLLAIKFSLPHFEKKPSVAVNFVTCFEIPLFKPFFDLSTVSGYLSTLAFWETEFKFRRLRFGKLEAEPLY